MLFFNCEDKIKDSQDVVVEYNSDNYDNEISENCYKNFIPFMCRNPIRFKKFTSHEKFAIAGFCLSEIALLLLWMAI